MQAEPNGHHPGAEIVLLAVAQSEVEAQMWAGAVRAEGISVLVQPGGPGMGAWASTAAFEHRLFVRRDQLAQAQEILGAGALPHRRLRRRRQKPRINRRVLRRSG